MKKTYRFQVIIAVLFFPFYFFGQTSFENVTSRIFGNDTYPNHMEGYSLVEVNENSLLLSTAYYAGGYSYLPKIFYANGVGVTSSFLPPILGGKKIIKTNDGNFMSIRVIDDLTFRISKFDFNGNIIWSTDRGYGIHNKIISDIVQTADGGYAITGFFSVQEVPFYSTFLLKLSNIGEVEWEKFFGSLSTHMEEGLALVETLDHGYAIACYQPYTTLNIFKTDNLGNLQWVTPIANGLQSAGGDLDILPDNSILVTGWNNGTQFLAKINELGSIVDLFEYPSDVVGNRFAANVKYISNPPGYLFVTNKFIITDIAGNILWTGDPEIPYVDYKDIIKMENGDMMAIGFVQTPTSVSSEVIEKIVLTRLSNSGILLDNEAFIQNNGFDVYPNPTSGTVNLKFNQKYNEINVSVINQLGQTISQNTFNNQPFCTINLEGSDGIYLIKVKFDNGEDIIKKIAKK